jgi:hypothetical protein
VNRGWLVWLIVLGLCGVAGAATMSTSTSGSSLGTSHVGVASTTTQTITVTNTGTGNLTFTVASDNADIVPSVTSGTLGMGEDAVVVVTMTPSARGTRSATITVAGNDGANPSDTFPVSGTGTSGNLVVAWTGSPGALDFGSALVATGTTTRTVTISNPAPANEALTFALDVSTGGADYVETTPASLTLAVDASVQITITFDPTAVGTRPGTFSITSDDSLGAGVLVSLTGIGQGAIFTPSSASLDIGTVDVGSFAEQTLTITNTGNLAADVTSISSGNAAFTFTVTGPALPRSVPPDGTVEVTVRFTPVDGSIVMADLSIATEGSPSTLTVPMTGDGLYKDVSVEVTGETDLMIDLGASRVGVLVTKLVTVTNTGETSVTLAAPTSDATPCTLLPVSPATLPAILAPLATATFEIHVTPAAVGAGACTITVTTDIPTTDTIELAYMGVASDVELVLPATGAINFGVVDVDATEIKTVVIGNDGTAPLNIGPCTLTGSARFSLVTSCTNLMVDPGATATLMVQFDPDVEASESATISFHVDALGTSQVDVVLSGVGADQRLDLSALSLSFPDTALADPAPPIEYIDVFNPTNPATGVAETLTISMVTSDAEVFVLANQGPFTVEPGAMIRLAVTFKPDAARTFDGSLTILSDASATPMATIALHGRGFAAEQQGGCCDSGRPTSAPLALGVLLLVIRRRRPRAHVTSARRRPA